MRGTHETSIPLFHYNDKNMNFREKYPANVTREQINSCEINYFLFVHSREYLKIVHPVQNDPPKDKKKSL